MIWFLTKLFDFLGGNVLNKAVDAWNKKQDAKIRQGEIDADVKKDLVNQYVNLARVESERQQALATHWQYWLLLSIFLIPLAGYWFMLTAYNIFWCQDCMFSQDWTVAAFTSPYDQWAMAMITFLFGVTTMAALFKGK